ncbi:MAG: hypothetical protein EOO77_09905 [Oxalobacteraceae bacterium]|nr:MAG: hypothetical protein EOO77_09905 [Oxalobacteraceae bacterium]
MSTEEAAAVKVRCIRVVVPSPHDTVASLSRAMAYRDHQEARFRALNGLGAGTLLPKGIPVKLVAWSR